MVRGLFLLFLSMSAYGETLVDDAVRALAQKVLGHLALSETAQVTSRNLTSLPAPEVTRAQAALDRALRRRVRNPVLVEVTLTISDNLQGYLLVAEIRHGSDRTVEMVSFRPEPPAAPARAGITLEQKLLWTQDAPILDLAVIEDEMLVVDTVAVTHYARREGKWQPFDSTPEKVSVRDPRGRLLVQGDSLTVHLPGVVCRGTWKPAMALACEPGGEFLAERNTLASQNYSEAQIGDRYVVAEPDGRTHVYDSARTSAGVFDEWGSDFGAVPTACRGQRVAAASTGDRDSKDFVALYDLVNNAPVRVGDPLEFPGPVTALWPAGNGVLTVVRNLVTGRYEAYSVTVDCGR